jgi:phosphatidylinositol phospholipase C beta
LFKLDNNKIVFFFILLLIAVNPAAAGCMSAQQFVAFLNEHQRDPRLNEILYPYADLARAKELIGVYEPDKVKAAAGHLSVEGFLNYLLGDDNVVRDCLMIYICDVIYDFLYILQIISPDSLDLSDDMDHPLAHYFINSSHNTYLIGHQLTGR